MGCGFVANYHAPLSAPDRMGFHENILVEEVGSIPTIGSHRLTESKHLLMRNEPGNVIAPTVYHPCQIMADPGSSHRLRKDNQHENDCSGTASGRM